MSKGASKVVLITGASSSVCESIAVHYASAGYRLVLCGRNGHLLRDTADRCVAVGASVDEIVLIQADLTKEDEVRGMVQQTVNVFSRLDVLVNGTGVALHDNITTTTVEHFDTALSTNLRAPFITSLAAVPHLTNTKGCIINISSVAGVRPVSNLLTFGMSKAALDHMTRSMAHDLGPKGIRVNCISLGDIQHHRPKRRKSLTLSLDNHEHQLNTPSPGTLTPPLRRAGSPHEVASVALFLASEEASYMTGAVIPVDGGWATMYPRAARHTSSESLTGGTPGGGTPDCSSGAPTMSGRHCTLVVRERNGLLSRHLAWPTSGTIG